jgi:glycine hydroxymethyltransferase
MKTSQFIEAHERALSGAIRLLPSENMMSPEAKAAYCSDIEGRYHTKFYAGKSAILQLIDHVSDLAKQVFHANHAFVTPISGNVCDLSALIGFTKAGDKVAITSFLVGGYPFNIERFERKRVDIPWNKITFNIDLDATLERIRQDCPALVILGTSFIMHPIPGVREIANAVHEAGGILAYDGSHPLGLIAGGEFQDPLTEGVDLLFGSTHKSFFGPQGGIILTNDDAIRSRLEPVIGADPDAGVVLVDNPNPGRIAALGVALEEMFDHGPVYAQQVVANTRALQETLASTSLGTCLAGPEAGLTDSHQVVAMLKEEKDAIQIMQSLEACGIFCDAGIRFGTAESTRLGYTEAEMSQIGQWIGIVLDPSTGDEELEQISNEVSRLAAEHVQVVL